ncbi:hypothetical protein OZX62_01640 [Bifidobacterium sp. ESL0690]|nr:hypothetical protein [Bifidobacterium sp. ESL0690]WEV47026.1 hypothetical protein OZX62_01640 [Bifidobacterium sp. ESL0690]
MRTACKIVACICLLPVTIIALVMGFWWLLGLTLLCGAMFLADRGE